jgi:hypothetical protein
VAEEGFRGCEEYEALGFDGAVALSNSVSLADLPRLQASVSGQLSAHDGHNPLSSPAAGRILITKVFLPARCTVERAGSAPGKEDGAAAPPGGGPVLVRRSAYPKHDAVYRVKKDDPKQRTWSAPRRRPPLARRPPPRPPCACG